MTTIAPNPIKRFLLVILGLVATGVAVIGIITPGLPTTVFLLIAVWAFAQSSQRLHDWLHRAPVFKVAMRHLKNFQEHGAVSLDAKIAAQVFAWGSFIIILVTTSNDAVIIRSILAIAAVSCSLAMIWLPTHNTSR